MAWGKNGLECEANKWLQSTLLGSDVPFLLSLCSPAHTQELQWLHSEGRESCQAFAGHSRKWASGLFFIILLLSFTLRYQPGSTFSVLCLLPNPYFLGQLSQDFSLLFLHLQALPWSIINAEVFRTLLCMGRMGSSFLELCIQWGLSEAPGDDSPPLSR